MSAVGIIGGALSIFGTVMSFSAQQQQNEEQTNISKQAENIKNQQMMLESTRQKRQALRQAIVGRSLAITNGSAQGAGINSSGVLAGAGNAISGGLEAEQTSNSATILGNRSFKNNLDYFNATQTGQFWSGLGQGIGAIGGVGLTNAGTITALGKDAGIGVPQVGSAYRGGWGSTGW